MTYSYSNDLDKLPVGHRIQNSEGIAYEKVEEGNWKPDKNSHGLWWYKDSLSLMIGSDWEDAE